MKELLFILIVCFTLNGFGQDVTFQLADNIPLFNGSTYETNYNNTKAYFNKCGLNLLANSDNMIIGVSIVIDSIGNPISPILIVGNDSIMFNAFVKCLNDSPKWVPATKDSINIACRYNLAFGK